MPRAQLWIREQNLLAIGSVGFKWIFHLPLIQVHLVWSISSSPRSVRLFWHRPLTYIHNPKFCSTTIACCVHIDGLVINMWSLNSSMQLASLIVMGRPWSSSYPSYFSQLSLISTSSTLQELWIELFLNQHNSICCFTFSFTWGGHKSSEITNNSKKYINILLSSNTIKTSLWFFCKNTQIYY